MRCNEGVGRESDRAGTPGNPAAGAINAFADMMRKQITMPAHMMDDGEHKGRTSRDLFSDYSAVTERRARPRPPSGTHFHSLSTPPPLPPPQSRARVGSALCIEVTHLGVSVAAHLGVSERGFVPRRI